MVLIWITAVAAVIGAVGGALAAGQGWLPRIELTRERNQLLSHLRVHYSLDQELAKHPGKTYPDVIELIREHWGD